MSRRSRAVLIAIALTILLATAARLRGPAPRPASAAPNEFSAVRAFDTLSAILREEVPHPVGSAANAVVRDRIATSLRSSGYQVRVHRSFVCNASLTCAWVENIVATPPDPALPLTTLVAHYDSVAAGPGASDDGAGVAVLLETARALRADRRIAFLVTDGEEAGLLGAEAFVRDDPLKNSVKAIVNIENRGTSGPSFFFETSTGNRNLIAAARRIPFPLSSSLYFTVYELLPNDTDVSVFKRAGLDAVNFAAIGGVNAYHTRLDKLEAVNLRTLQHHGDHALSIARSLADMRTVTASSNSTWFDILGFTLVSWPERWNPFFAAAALILVLLSSRRSRFREIAAGIVSFISVIVVTAASTFGLSALAYLRSDGNWLAYPHAAIAAAWLAGIVVTAAGAKLASRWGNPQSGVAIAWGASGLALAITLPGASYLIAVPILIYAIVSLAASPDAARIVWFTSAALLVAPFVLVLYDALGRIGLVAIATLIALVATSALSNSPIRWKHLFIAACVVIVLAVVSAMLPPYTATHPRLARIRHPLAQPAVSYAIAHEGERVMLRVESSRAADQIIVAFNQPLRIVAVNGVAPAPPNRQKHSDSRSVVIYGRSAVIALERPLRPVSFTLTDSTWGVPATALRERPAFEVPYGRGDVTVSEVKGSIEATAPH